MSVSWCVCHLGVLTLPRISSLYDGSDPGKGGKNPPTERMLRKMPREHAIYLLWLFSYWKWHSSWTLSTKETAKALDATLQEDEGRTWLLDFHKTMRYTVAWMLNKDKQDHHHPCSNPQPLGSTRDLISSHITDAPPPKTATQPRRQQHASNLHEAWHCHLRKGP